jgi:GGDEF domain-containing protein
MNRESDRQDEEQTGDAERLPQLLRRLLTELDSIERRAVAGGASRRLIQHGRSLDSLLWQAHRQWKEYNRQADAGTLDALCLTLVAAHEDAEQLKVALDVTSAPLADSASDRPSTPEASARASTEPEPPGEIEVVRHRIRDLLGTLERRLSAAAGSPEPTGSPAPADSPVASYSSEAADPLPVTALERPETPADESAGEVDSSAVEGMLWRITSDWQHLQRAPSPDRIALLCDKLERASDEVRRLAADIEDVSRRTVPEAAVPSQSGAGHPPFRDPMTGALSREGFDVLVIGELKRSRRYRRPFTLLLFEAHEGDARGMADAVERLTVGLRGSDFIGRYVDRLVAVGLPETSSEAALLAARRVMRSMPAGSGADAAPKFGMASLPEDGRTLAELAALARRQLREGPVSLGESGRDYWGV